MPPKLNIQERCTVGETFLAVLMEMWKERWKVLNDEILHSDPRYKNAPMMTRLKANVTDKNAFDFQKTQLVCLPFTRFSTLEYKETLWLVGLTKPIVLTDGGCKRWQGPRYTIYIPRDVLQRGTGSKFHFVPEGREIEYARHPHHNATGGRGVSHPLDMDPSTCWGSFPNIVTQCIRAGDVVNLFRTLHIYLTRVDMNSLLTRPFEMCTQFTRLQDVTPEPTVPVRKYHR